MSIRRVKHSLRSAVALTILFNFLTGRLDSFLEPIKGWERKRCYTCTCIGVSLRAEHQAFVGHFIVVSSVPWPLNDSEARSDLVLIKT